MDWPRAKTILIILLLCVCAALGGILLLRGYEDRRAKELEREEAILLLEKNGYVIGQRSLPEEEAPVIDLERDVEAERRAAEAILGKAYETLVLSPDGASIRYNCYLGSAGFGAGGIFDMMLTEPLSTDSARLRCAELIRHAGMWTEQETPPLLACEEGWRLRAGIGGLPVWDSGAVFTITGGAIMSVTGRWPFGGKVKSESGGSNTAEWALLALAGYLTPPASPGELLGIELGYLTEITAPGMYRLTPHWLVSLPGGDYYVNAVTGEVRRT